MIYKGVKYDEEFLLRDFCQEVLATEDVFIFMMYGFTTKMVAQMILDDPEEFQNKKLSFLDCSEKIKNNAEL